MVVLLKNFLQFLQTDPYTTMNMWGSATLICKIKHLIFNNCQYQKKLTVSTTKTYHINKKNVSITEEYSFQTSIIFAGVPSFSQASQTVLKCCLHTEPWQSEHVVASLLKRILFLCVIRPSSDVIQVDMTLPPLFTCGGARHSRACLGGRRRCIRGGCWEHYRSREWSSKGCWAWEEWVQVRYCPQRAV